MTEAVGACSLLVVAYLATRPGKSDPLWTLKAITYPPSPGSIRRHDGTGRMWDDGVFVAPPRLPDPLPDPGPGPEGPHPPPEPSPSPVDGDGVTLRLELMEARLLAWLDMEYVDLCERMQVEPSAVAHTAKHNARKGESSGNTSKKRLHAPAPVGVARGRRRVRGGVRVA